MRKRIVYSLNDKLKDLKKQRRSTPNAKIKLSILWIEIKIVLVDWDNSLTTDYRLEQLNKKRQSKISVKGISAAEASNRLHAAFKNR